MADMDGIMERVTKTLSDGNGHFVLAVGDNDDWIAYVQMDEDDEMAGYSTGNTPTEALVGLYEVL